MSQDGSDLARLAHTEMEKWTIHCWQFMIILLRYIIMVAELESVEPKLTLGHGGEKRSGM